MKSFSRPDGNLTGAARLNVELEPKRLEMLHQLVPTAKTVALLLNPANPNIETILNDSAAAARMLGFTLHVFKAGTDRDLDLAFGGLDAVGAAGLVIAPDAFFIGRSARLAELALAHRIPAIFEYREFVAAGGLASYAGNPMESYRLIGRYVARILKGEKPADLPVAIREARADHQSKDREGARPYGFPSATDSRRRPHRMISVHRFPQHGHLLFPQSYYVTGNG